MKKKWFLIATIFVALFILPAFCTGFAEEVSPEDNNTFLFPSSVKIIEDEAFEGTSVKIVILPDGLLYIGARTFDNAPFLTDVYIPDTTEHIADSAFYLTSNLTIHGIDGSYAKDWAYKHKVPFIVDDIWNVFVPGDRSQNTQTNPINRFIATIVLVILFSLFRCCYFELRSRRPQDRPELNPIDYRFPQLSCMGNPIGA